MTGDQKPLHTMKTTFWSVTYWLTDGRTIEGLNALVSNMPSNWAIEGQIEQGKDSQDKLHAQLFLRTDQCRGSKIYKYFPHSHIEEGKNKFALKNYVHKDDTRVGEYKTVENRSPAWKVVRDMFYDWLVKTQQVNEYADELEKYRLWDRFIIISLKDGMEIDLIGVNPQYRSCINKYWEAGIYNARERVQAVSEPTSPTVYLVPPPPVDKIDKTDKVVKFQVRSPPPSF